MDLKVEELLASIRRSVDDDLDGLGTSMNSQSRGTLMRGALREMRVNMGAGDVSGASQDEISTLRERIRRKMDETSSLPTPAAAPILPKPIPAVNPSRRDFTGILAAPAAVTRPSDHMRNQVERAQHVPLRATYVDDSTSDIRYQQRDSPQDWSEDNSESAYEQSAYEQPYGGHEQGQYPVVQSPLMSAHAEAAAETAFRQLSDSLLSRATGDRTIEDMTRELLRGMIKQWLDANLPTMVEEMVREEIERVARRGR